MLPYKSLLKVDKNDKVPVYQQLTNQLIHLIRQGTLKPGQKIPGTRQISELLDVHRKTVTRVYFELMVQGWIEAVPGSGTFVAKNLPEFKPSKFREDDSVIVGKAGFSFEARPFLKRELVTSSDQLHLDDGFPDPRLAPLTDLARAYRSNLVRGNAYQKLGYGETKGTLWLRQQLAVYLSETRGLKITVNNVMIVRGTVMGLYLTNLAFVKPHDIVVTGSSGWTSAVVSFRQAGANVMTIPVDENGLVVEALEELCQQHTVRLIYITPHHNYPTTVTLKADRRIKLLNLAKKYRFIVFEDDYDYDFHYLSRPLLPLASADDAGVVLYSGSFTKSISPAFRVGYLVAPEEVVEYLSHYRRIIDRQGDNMLENSVAELLQEGTIQKHLRRALKEYRQRRDIFCGLLRDKLGDEIEFQTPEGGMSVWATFDKGIDMAKTAAVALKSGLYFSNGLQHNQQGVELNSTRLGYASSDTPELERCVEILKKSISRKASYFLNNESTNATLLKT